MNIYLMNKILYRRLRIMEDNSKTFNKLKKKKKSGNLPKAYRVIHTIFFNFPKEFKGSFA